MKKIFFSLFSLVIAFSVDAQRANKLTLANNGASITLRYLLDQNVVIDVNQDGTLGEWGVDRYANRPVEFVQRKLDRFDGRVEYYNESENEAFRGKIKFIGRTLITYYASTDQDFQVGKIKSIGTAKFNYYTNADDAMQAGKLKIAGSLNFSYYNSYENQALRGKVKNAGNVPVNYYSSFDDNVIAGKIKSLNGGAYTYYINQEQNFAKGSLKTGRMIQVINGVTYFIKN
jgi:hypothetical protein